MNNNEKKNIHSLFESTNYMEVYKTYPHVVNEMLMIESLADFEDFIEAEGVLEENIFWLYFSAVNGESLLIGGYEEDVTEKVSVFLKQKLPETVFGGIKGRFFGWYVDLGTKDTIEEKTGTCNQLLNGTGYSIKADYEDDYCAGAYFLSVTCH